MRALLFLFAAVAASLVAEVGFAEQHHGSGADSNESSARIVVSANRAATPQGNVGSSVTVITREEIERSQKHLLLDILREVPGVDVVRSGGPGGNTTIFMRGANSEHTLVVLDGVELNNPGTPSRSFNFANLTLDNVERIEVLRGPQSSLYGSDAIGGVILITTRRGEGETNGSLSVEAGSFYTFREQVLFDTAEEFGTLSFGFSREDSDSFSAADERQGNKEDDGYENTTFSTRAQFIPSELFKLDLSYRHTDSEADIDRAGGVGGDDPNRFLDTRESFFSTRASSSLLGGIYQPSIGFGLNDQTFSDNNDIDSESQEFLRSRFEGRLLKWDTQHQVRLDAWGRLIIGAETEEEQAESTFFSDGPFGSFENNFSEREIRNNGYFGDILLTPSEEFSTSLGLRLDDHDSFDSQVTFRVAPVYDFTKWGTRLRGAVGTGFKAPSLAQLFSSFGNPELEPEESLGWEIGVEQDLLDGALELGVVFFRNDIDQLITFDPQTFIFQNIEKAEITGFEFYVQAEPIEQISMAASYTFTDAEDESLGNQLLRRPESKAHASAFYQFAQESGEIGVRVRFVGHRFDNDFSTFPAERVRLASYTLVDLLGSLEVGENVEIFARVENLFDKQYQDVLGFGAAGVAGFGGVRAFF